MLSSLRRTALYSHAHARALSTGLTKKKYFPDLVRSELERKQASRQFGSTMTPLAMWDNFVTATVRWTVTHEPDRVHLIYCATLVRFAT